jgi:hypothetical protein
VSSRDFHNSISRNNADLGKGVPRQHVFMTPVNSSFLCLFHPPEKAKVNACGQTWKRESESRFLPPCFFWCVP